MSLELNTLSCFLPREQCPVCSQIGPVAIDSPYNHPRLQSWLNTCGGFGDRIPDGILDQGRFVVRYCESCSLLYHGEVLSDPMLNDLYEQWIKADDGLQSEIADFDAVPFRFLRTVGLIPSAVCKPPTKTRVLDFGAGWGTWALLAKSLGYETFVAELSPSRVAHCKSLGLNMATLDLADVAEHRQLYDFIHAEQVLEHLPNPGHVLSALVKCLAPGGSIYIGVPDGRKLVRKLPGKLDLSALSDKELKVIAPFQHVNAFTTAALKKLGQPFGLKPIRCRSRFIHLKRGVISDVTSWLSKPFLAKDHIVFRLQA